MKFALYHKKLQSRGGIIEIWQRDHVDPAKVPLSSSPDFFSEDTEAEFIQVIQVDSRGNEVQIWGGTLPDMAREIVQYENQTNCAGVTDYWPVVRVHEVIHIRKD